MNETKIIPIAMIAGLVLLAVSVVLPQHGTWSEKDAAALIQSQEKVAELEGVHHTHGSEEEEPAVDELVDREADPAEREVARKEFDRLRDKLGSARTSGRPLKLALRWLGILSLVVAVGFFVAAKLKE